MEFMTIEEFDGWRLKKPNGNRKSIADLITHEGKGRWIFQEDVRPSLVADLLMAAMPDWTWVCVCTYGEGPWRSNEDLNLFEIFRNALGAQRSEAFLPVHSFSKHDHFHLRSFFYMTIAFGRDMTVFTNDGNEYFEITHDSAVYFDDPESENLARLRMLGADIEFVPSDEQGARQLDGDPAEAGPKEE